MIPTTIKTTNRIFQVTDLEANTYLCNLDTLSINSKGLLVGANGVKIAQIKHYWNNKFKVINKHDVKEMIFLNK